MKSLTEVSKSSFDNKPLESNGTEDGTWADDIEDYKEKLSSLQSYLEKFREKLTAVNNHISLLLNLQLLLQPFWNP